MAPRSRALPDINNLTQLYTLLNSSVPLAQTIHPSAISPTPSCSIDESYKYIFLPMCYSFTFIFSISLNSVILYRSFQRTKRWNASLIYMVNLASTDFMYGFSLPFLIASYIMHDRWIFGDFMCRLVRFLFYFNLYCSIFFLTCISVHRYLGICHPMRTITLETKRAVKWTCVLIWGVVFALTCPIFRFAQTGNVARLAGAGNDTSVGGSNLGQSLISSSDRHGNLGEVVEVYQNCWDDAIDKEFSDYVPYGIILHLLGFFVPFSIIAWCYSHVVLTIFRTLHSQPLTHGEEETLAREEAREEGGAAGRGSRTDVVGGRERRSAEQASVITKVLGRDAGISIYFGANSLYAHRRRKSIKTIITITFLFALCFFPFHVTRTIFLILKVTKAVPCNTMTMVSMCYKITRPLASFNAWLNALLYFLTKETGGAHCCKTPNNAQQNSGLLWPIRIMGKAGEAGHGGEEEGIDDREGKEMNTTSVHIHRQLRKVRYTLE
ncbi:P2Y purinoceptor 2 [Lampris incognitus]|uniref:P2Y purinoceptor 2 n=1 Tax=Lampris incognitus TaxID=2546036 RepID=UPI0024B4DC20|nr:P2Y purinoceptor 2 [Lampris incognitus]